MPAQGLRGVWVNRQGCAGSRGDSRGRPLPDTTATDVFLIRFLICGQSNCNWFVIVSPGKDTAAEKGRQQPLEYRRTQGFAITFACVESSRHTQDQLLFVPCCGKYLSFIVIALVRSIVFIVRPCSARTPTPSHCTPTRRLVKFMKNVVHTFLATKQSKKIKQEFVRQSMNALCHYYEGF